MYLPYLINRWQTPNNDTSRLIPQLERPGGDGTFEMVTEQYGGAIHGTARHAQQLPRSPFEVRCMGPVSAAKEVVVGTSV